MKSLKTALIALKTRLANNRAMPLPVTDAAVEDVIKRAIEGAGLDSGNDSLRNAVATTLLSLPNGTRTIRVADLVGVINQARLKQASYNIIEAIRTADKAAKEAAKQNEEAK